MRKMHETKYLYCSKTATELDKTETEHEGETNSIKPLKKVYSMFHINVAISTFFDYYLHDVIFSHTFISVLLFTMSLCLK